MQPRSRTLLALAPVALVAAVIALRPLLSGREPATGTAGTTVASGSAEAPARPQLDPAGRRVLPGTDCLAPSHLAPAGPSPRCAISFERGLAAMGLAPGGKLLVVSLTHAATAVWLLPQATLGPMFEPLPVDTEARAVLVREGSDVALLGVGSRLHWYDTASGRLDRSVDGPGGVIRDLAWSGDGSRIAAAAGGAAYLLDGDGEKLRSFAVEGEVLQVAIDRPGRLVALGTDIGSIAVFDLTRDGPEFVVSPSLEPVAGVDFARDRLLVAGADGSLRALDPGSGRETARADVGSPLVALAVSADGRLVATAARDRLIRLHVAPRFDAVGELDWHQANLGFLGFGAGPTLVSADNGGELAVWDAGAFAR